MKLSNARKIRLLGEAYGAGILSERQVTRRIDAIILGTTMTRTLVEKLVRRIATNQSSS